MAASRNKTIPTLTVLFLLTAGSSFTPVASAADEALPDLVKKVQPATVLVLTYDASGQALSQGSGFFISPEGDVITNYHVLYGASPGAFGAEIKTAEGKVYNVTRILGKDVVADLIRLAVEIPADKVHPLKLAASLPESGERVVVIGNPLGLEQTVSDGIVSAVRDDPGFGPVIQITAPISPGSSGSPVVNLKGEVVAVATFQI